MRSDGGNVTTNYVLSSFRTIALSEIKTLNLAELLAVHFELVVSDADYHNAEKRATIERAGAAAIHLESYAIAMRRQYLSLRRQERVAGRNTYEAGRSAILGEANRINAFIAAGQVQTQMHLISICICQISRMLSILMADCGVTPESDVISREDKVFLENYRVFRDSFEHFDERLPGRKAKGKSPGEAFVVRGRTDMSSEIGLIRDVEGRVSVAGHSLNLTKTDIKRIDMIISNVQQIIRDLVVNDVSAKLGGDLGARIQVPLSLTSSPF